MDWVHESLAMDTDHTEGPVMCQEMYDGWTASKPESQSFQFLRQARLRVPIT